MTKTIVRKRKIKGKLSEENYKNKSVISTV
jgi:hypothetical protein